MKAYKGFCKSNDGRIYCKPVTRKFYYEEGNTYTLPEGEEPKLCECGFHACIIPMDVFRYYNSLFKVETEYHEVELEDVSEERSCDSKIVGRKITIGRKLTEDEMLEISIKMMVENNEKYFDDKEYAIVNDWYWSKNFIDRNGKLLSEEWFDVAYVFRNGFAIVKKGGAYNFIDTDGKLLSEEWFDQCCNFYEGFGRVCIGDKWNFIDKEGKITES